MAVAVVAEYGNKNVSDSSCSNSSSSGSRGQETTPESTIETLLDATEFAVDQTQANRIQFSIDDGDCSDSMFGSGAFVINSNTPSLRTWAVAVRMYRTDICRQQQHSFVTTNV